MIAWMQRQRESDGKQYIGREFVCLATSADSVAWIKPELNLFPRPDFSRQSNLVCVNSLGLLGLLVDSNQIEMTNGACLEASDFSSPDPWKGGRYIQAHQ